MPLLPSPPSDSYDAFLSYARDDTEPFVERLYRALIEHGLRVWWDRANMPSRGEPFSQEIRKAIDDSSRLIIVCGPKALHSEWVRAEWQYALRSSGRCTPVMPVLRIGGMSNVPPELTEFHCIDMEAEDRFEPGVQALIRDITAGIPPLAELHGVPSLPNPFLSRVAVLAHLKDLVMPDLATSKVVDTHQRVSAIVGMGGSGKSVLAAAFARECSSRRAFTDGIFWLRFGAKADSLTKLSELAMHLNPREIPFVSFKDADERLIELLHLKRCLLILDDVWKIADVEPFRNIIASDTRSRLLITTRQNDLAVGLGAGAYTVRDLTDDEAMALLCQWLGCYELPAQALDVAHACHNHPFALALCGAMASEGVGWETMLQALNHADLGFLEHQFANYEYTDVLKSLDASIELLNAVAKKHYYEFAVFPKTETTPEDIVVRLWIHTNGVNDLQARKLVTDLKNRSLIQVFEDVRSRKIVLHDLQHDYVHAKARALLLKLHNTLLDMYEIDDWSELPENDPYLWDRLAYHLAEAERGDELLRTIFNPDFVIKKIAARGAHAFKRDLAEAIRLFPADEQLKTWDRLYSATVHLYNVSRSKEVIAANLHVRTARFPEMKQFNEVLKSLVQPPFLAPRFSLPDILSLDQVATLFGHSGSVLRCRCSIDGRWILSASLDGSVRIWNGKTYELERVLRREPSAVGDIPLGNDHRWKLEKEGEHTSSLATLMINETRTDETRHSTRSMGDILADCAISPDGSYAVAASWDGTLPIWEIAKGSLRATLRGHTGYVNACRVGRNGDWIVSAGEDATLILWNADRCLPLRTLSGHSGAVLDCVFSPDERSIISASADHTLRIWDVETGETRSLLSGHTAPVNACAITRDGSRIVSASDDSTVCIWDARTGKLLRKLSGHEGPVFSCCISSDERQIISGGADHKLRVWDIRTGRLISTHTGHTWVVNFCAAMPDSRQVVSASADWSLKVWDLDAHTGEPQSGIHKDDIYGCAINSDNTLLATASVDETAKVWDARTQDLRATLPHKTMLSAAVFSPDSSWLATAGDDGEVYVWDVAKQTLLKRLRGHKDSVIDCAVSPDGTRIVSAGWDHILIVWDTGTYKRVRTLKGHTDAVLDCSYSPDQTRIVSSSKDATVKVWNAETGKALMTYGGHEGFINACAFNRAGAWIASGEDNGIIHIWDAKTGDLIHLLEGHTATVYCLAFSHDDRWLASVSADGTVRLWDMESSANQTTFAADGWLYGCAFSPINDDLYVVGEQGAYWMHMAQSYVST